MLGFARIFNTAPFPYPSVGLNFCFYRLFDGVGYPFLFDDSSVWPLSDE